MEFAAFVAVLLAEHNGTREKSRTLYQTEDESRKVKQKLQRDAAAPSQLLQLLIRHRKKKK